jgi:hypothetical protein
MTDQIEYIKASGFKVPAGTSETVKDHLYVLARKGVVLYYPNNKHNVVEELRSIAHDLKISLFENHNGLCLVNETGAGGNKPWNS